MCKKVMVVGGPTNLVYGPLSKKLGDHGIEVGWHVSRYDGDTSSFTGIPASCDGVLILTDMANHPTFLKVKSAAKDAGVPLGCIPRKWSVAEGMLRAQGILKPVSNGDVPAKVSLEEITETAAAYIFEEGGRTPKKDEVEAAVQRALGPKVKLSYDDYYRAKCKAARDARITPKPSVVPAAPPDMTKEVYDWTMFFIEEDPSRVHNEQELVNLVSKHAEVRFASAREVIGGITKDITTRWARRNPEDVAFREQMMVLLIKHQFELWLESGKDYPDSRTAEKYCGRVFGVQSNRRHYQQGRAMALGEWATELVHIIRAQKHADSRWPDLKLDIRDLLEQGVLKHVPAGDRLMTSIQAVDELAETIKAGKVPPVQTPKAGKVPAVKTPKAVKQTPKAVEPAPVVVTPPVPVKELQEEMLTLASIVEEAISQKLQSILSPIEARLKAIEEKLEAGAQVNISTLLDRVLGSSEVTGITVSIDPNSLRKTPKQGG